MTWAWRSLLAGELSTGGDLGDRNSVRTTIVWAWPVVGTQERS